MNSFNGFAVNSSHIDTEEKCIHLYALKNDIPYRYFDSVTNIPKDWIPVGTIDWFLGYTKLKEDIFKESYPSFLSHTLKRNVWLSSTLPNAPSFIKPADKLKRFNGTVISKHLIKQQKKGPYICSDIVHFTNECRYYIDDGQILGSSWYTGEAENDMIEPPAPSLDKLQIEWPKRWVGAVDFGIEKDKGLCLVEVNPPFATGNYLGLDSNIYPKWIIDGFFYRKE